MKRVQNLKVHNKDRLKMASPSPRKEIMQEQPLIPEEVEPMQKQLQILQ